MLWESANRGVSTERLRLLEANLHFLLSRNFRPEVRADRDKRFETGIAFLRKATKAQLDKVLDYDEIESCKISGLDSSPQPLSEEGLGGFGNQLEGDI